MGHPLDRFTLAIRMDLFNKTVGIINERIQYPSKQFGIKCFLAEHHDLLHDPPVDYLTILIAIGEDYNIFLMTRVREQSVGRPPKEGVRLAAAVTGGIITACGLILAGTFGVLAFSPIRTLEQVGASVAIGVLIDTFVVRALLVPAIASLVGRWNWWPAKLSKQR